MTFLKKQLEKRNFHFRNIKSYANNNRPIIDSGLTKEIDRVIFDGNQLIEELDTMFWSDADYIDDIIKYLDASDKALDTINNQIEDPHIEVISSLLYLQTESFKIFFEKLSVSVSNEENKVPIHNLSKLIPSKGNQGYN